MPHVTIELRAGRSTEQKSKLAASITESFVQVLGSKPEDVKVEYVEVPAPTATMQK
jgi:phenylpyruvate tautomerase PptA (4-oxalocrotonate tautomerase family)